MLVKDRTFVITGGASGLGAATVEELHNNGAYIAILDLSEDNANDLIKQLGSTPRLKAWAVDVSDTESISEAVQSVLSWTHSTKAQIGGIVLAAGIGLPGKAIDRKGNAIPIENFDTVININLRGSVDVMRQFLPEMIKNQPLQSHSSPGSPSKEDPGDGERGVIIFVSSVAAYDGQPGQLAYSASKGAVAGMMLPLARDLAPFGIRALAIAPGVFESAMTNLMSDKVRNSLLGVMEFPKRMGRAVEFARMARHCVENVMLNATTIRLDGAVRMPSKM